MSGANARLWRLAAPVILSNISVPLLGAVDTAVMGHLPDPAFLGGVALGALVFDYIYWGFGFLRMGTTGLVAQAHGAGDADEVRAVLARGALLVAGLALLVLALQGPLIRLAFDLLDASPRVDALARSYVRIRIWGAPAALLTYVVLGWLFGLQRMMAALTLTVVANGLNIILDLVFVLGLGWGIEGVALATLIAEWTSAALGLWLIARHLARLGGGWRRHRILDRARIAALLRVNRDIFVRTLLLISAFAWFTAQSARMGDVTLAANAVLLNFQTFMAYALDGFANAAEALVGEALGRGARARLRRAVVVSSRWALAFALGFTMVYLVLGEVLIAALTNIVEVRDMAALYLPWVVASPLISVWSFQLDGIFIGATRGSEMRNGMILSFALYIAVSWVTIPRWGNHGLWLALILFLAARGVTLALWYPRIERAADRVS